MSSQMRRILELVGVEKSVITTFEAQKITPDLTDAQLVELEISTLGKRQLIRFLCENVNFAIDNSAGD